MVLKPQTSRNWKLATAILSAGAAFQLVFRTDFGEREHIFSGAQRWYNAQINALMGIETNPKLTNQDPPPTAENKK
ncbi:unnamed protein product [Heterosigma akashiwo]